MDGRIRLPEGGPARVCLFAGRKLDVVWHLMSIVCEAIFGSRAISWTWNSVIPISLPAVHWKEIVVFVFSGIVSRVWLVNENVSSASGRVERV